MTILYLACWFFLINVSLSNPVEKVVPDYRLIDNILPSHYDIRITPYLLETDKDKFTFDGEVWITVKAQKPSLKEIVLQARDITFELTEVYKEGNEANKLKIERTDPDKVTDKFSIKLTDALDEKDSYILHFKYRGILGDDMHGFYKSSYVNAEGKTIWIGSTQFQTNHARRAFPCFDEPQFKATFQVEITHPSYYNVISNTKIQEANTLPNGNTITIFKKTPKMSTYLLAFLVSDFKTRNENTEFPVIARPEAYDQTEYASIVGPKLLEILDDYTGYPYSKMNLEKMHLAGIPDFSAGAMENWGLLTYRETALLYDPNASTYLNQQRVATVIAHEQAHMWFGDLVTCKWWGYTWLNEGFARYMQYFVTHEVENTWELDKQFVVEQIHSVFNMDSLKGTTPLNDRTAASPADLSRMFNSISYNKGASVIRMVIHMMGAENFKSAIQSYLKLYEYDTSVPERLYTSLEEKWTNNNVSLSKLLTDWTDQVGYPVVTIHRSSDGKTLEVSQKRFLLRPDAGDDKILYTIPLTFTTNNEKDFTNTKASIFLPKSESTQKFMLSKSADWIIANIQQNGYYRVNYDYETWNNIIKALKSENFGGIHELNRANIVDDVFNFGRSGLISYDLVMNVLSYLEKETNYLAWYPAFTGYNYLTVRLGKRNGEHIRNHLLKQIDHVYNQVGFEQKNDEARLVTYNRVSVLTQACQHGHEDCIKQAKEYFKNSPVPVNIRAPVYCTAVREGGKEEFETLWNKFKTENVASEQVTILTALGCAKNPEILTKYIDYILSSDVRLQDKSSAYNSAISQNIENVEIVFDHSVKNLQKMFEQFGSKSSVATLFSNMASRISEHEFRDKFKSFIESNGKEFGDAVSTLNSALDNANYNLDWSDRHLESIVQGLKGGAATISMNTLLIVVSSYVIATLLI